MPGPTLEQDALLILMLDILKFKHKLEIDSMITITDLEQKPENVKIVMFHEEINKENNYGDEEEEDKEAEDDEIYCMKVTGKEELDKFMNVEDMIRETLKGLWRITLKGRSYIRGMIIVRVDFSQLHQVVFSEILENDTKMEQDWTTDIDTKGKYYKTICCHL